MSMSNEINAEMAKRFFGEVRRTYDDEETRRASFRGDMSAIKSRRDDVYERAESAGVPKKLLKARIRQWLEDVRIKQAQDRRAAQIPEDLDDRALFDALCEALGEFKDTPLGEAALASSVDRITVEIDGEEIDLRPDFLKNKGKDDVDDSVVANNVRNLRGIKPLKEKPVVGLPGADAESA
jgi:hypothetical protein